MAKTMRWPPQISRGRTVWTETPEEAVAQVVRLSVTGKTGGHPFDAPEEGLEAFAAGDGAADLQVAALVRQRFRDLERQRRARLVSLSVEHNAKTGERVIRVGYLSLETNQRETLEVPING